MPEYGYIRVSSNGVSEAEQYSAVIGLGVAPENIFTDKEEPEYSQRPAFQELLSKLLSGDHLYVYSLDRLDFKCEGISVIWGLLTETRGVHVSVIDVLHSLADGSGHENDIYMILIKTLAAVSQSERDHASQLGRERVAAAIARGVRFGTPPMERPPELYRELTSAWERGEITAREAGNRLGVTHAAWLKWMKKESRVRVKGRKKRVKSPPKASPPLPTGRPPKKLPSNFLAVTSAWEDKEISASEAARMLGVCRSTFMRWVAEWC